MRQWFRFLFVLIPIILPLLSCDDSPTSPESTGKIQLVIVDDSDAQDSEADSTSAINKQTAIATLTELEVRVLTNSNSLVSSETLFPEEGWFEGTIEVKAQNNLKVLCIGKSNGVVERFAMDSDVDVKAGQTTVAEIPETHWYTRQRVWNMT